MSILLAIASLLLGAALAFTLATALVNQVDRGVPPRFSRDGIGWLTREWATAAIMPAFLLAGRWGRDTPHPPGHPARRQPPVLLVPGYGLNRGSLLPLARALRAQGWPWVQAVDPLPRAGSIPDQAHSLASQVEATLQASGADRVILIGHSMGGLVAGWYVNQMNGAARVQRIISLATPWQGTRMHIWGRHAHELRPGSPTLAPLLPCAVPVTAIFSPHDGVVSPPESAHPAGIESIEIPYMGHMQLLFSARLYRAVAHALAGLGEAEE